MESKLPELNLTPLQTVGLFVFCFFSIGLVMAGIGLCQTAKNCPDWPIN